MFGQQDTKLSPLPSNIFTCALAGLFFALSTWAPFSLWRPFVCGIKTKEDGICEFDPTVALLGVAIAALAHSISVAIFAWTPLSAPLRSSDKSTRRSSLFNVFLYASMACDIVAYGHALTFMQGIAGFLQAVTITFNAPFIVFAPYILAAYADPSTDLGSFVHRIKARIAEHASSDLDECPCGESNCIHKGLERAMLIMPSTFESDEYGSSNDYHEEEGYFEEDMSTRSSIPRFSLFVAVPTDSTPEQHMPLPVSQRV